MANLWRQQPSGRLRAQDLIQKIHSGTSQFITNGFFEQVTSSYFGILKRWTGSIWTIAKLKIYNGAFVEKQTKRWNGSSWVLINTTGN